jgi:hypothetical protein
MCVCVYVCMCGVILTTLLGDKDIKSTYTNFSRVVYMFVYVFVYVYVCVYVCLCMCVYVCVCTR